MKVLFVNTGSAGGATIASARLASALEKEGVMVSTTGRTGRTGFLLERLSVLAANGLSRNGLFTVDFANAGEDITSSRAFREADIIHLHWINQGFISLGTLKKITHCGKPVVWTLHDMWPFTGICHHSGSCEGYFTDGCSNCRMLRSRFGGTVAARVFTKKAAALEGAGLSFVGCSRWITAKAELSPICKGHSVVTIPNTLDTDTFKPRDRDEARKRLGLPLDKRLILFCAQKITNEKKGIKYLLEACRSISDAGVIILGENAGTTSVPENLEKHLIGYTSDQARMADIYNAADIYVTPSLEDNLPNTVMEAMACGVPCVGFDIGGIPEMIDHLKTGYIAEYRSSEDLAAGMLWALDPAGRDGLREASRRKVLECWSEKAVAGQYLELYRKLLQNA